MLGRDRTWMLILTVLTATSAALCVAAAAAPTAPEPVLAATPQGGCGPGSNPETGMQGRVPPADIASGRAAQGYTCNTEVVGSYGTQDPFMTVGGYKVLRYIDKSGRECAYYDTTLLLPTNVVNGVLDLFQGDQARLGVAVLDMADPAHPVQTTSLLTPAMLSPHESLVLSEARGLLVAVLGNPAFLPGVVDVYDISQDCRYPKLKSTSPDGILGHESGMAPDGRTFYSASAGGNSLVAVSLDNPTQQKTLWIGNYPSHGLSISDDGNRAYLAGVNGELIILDTSEIQARAPRPTVREVSRLTWKSASIPQNAIPVTIAGHRYVVEVDEFGSLSEVGAARVIDIGDETKPQVISNLRLEVHQRPNFATLAADPGAKSNPTQGYAAHYCNVPRRTDPGIVACSMIQSGLRVFDIRDPFNPKEVAYFNAPATPKPIVSGLNFLGNNWAMSSPSFAPERCEIWYTDGFTGFWAVRVTNGAWAGCGPPAAPAAPAPGPDPAAVVPVPAVQPAEVVRSRPALPATGGSPPAALLLSTALGAVLMLAALRPRRSRSRSRH